MSQVNLLRRLVDKSTWTVPVPGVSFDRKTSERGQLTRIRLLEGLRILDVDLMCFWIDDYSRREASCEDFGNAIS